jgi:hypothetical protein
VLHRWLKESSEAKQPIGSSAGTGTNAVVPFTDAGFVEQIDQPQQ